ncbi:MAG: flagellar biosynthesis protein FlhF [Deltaproteobacteria bacterium]|nr:flagellar biosynthesis protein FlhF [Deltaproteobacteria bacterium]
MHIKRFTGPTVKDAMRLIKAEFGESALILNTKKINSNLHEVIAAVDYDLSNPISLSIAEEAKAEPVKKAKPRSDAGDGGNETGDGGRREARPVDFSQNIKKELGELKELKELCLTMMSQAKNPVTELFAKLESELVANGIDKRLAQKIILNTFKGINKDKAADAGYLKARMKNSIYERISVADPLSERGVVAFVGPSGVGKTTTIAKLTAIHALKKKKKIALLTMDTYRIAAAEQLKVYGKIIGVPVEVAKDTKELSTYMNMHRDKDLVLIDTAGRSQRNATHMKDLYGISRISPNIRFNLVLSSETRDEALYDSIKGFGAIPIDSLTFTKLDCSGVYGPILNTMLLARKPVSYLTAGQRVPEDIETATKDRLLNFFMPN